MVYGYGLGTGNIKVTIKDTKNNTPKTKDSEGNSVSTISNTNDGSWRFYAGEGSLGTIKNDFIWSDNNKSDIGIELTSAENVPFVRVSPKGKTALLTFGQKLNNIQVTLRVNLDSFNGTFVIIHHFIDNENYDFVAFRGKNVEMGRLVAGLTKSFGRDTFPKNGWLDIKVISAETHFRTLINGNMIVHGHGDLVKPGTAGIKFMGSGSFSLSSFGVQVIN